MSSRIVKYVLITAAYNEQDYIEKTIISVINQTHKPFQWVIVNDGSNDSTGEIIKKYLDQYHFIKLINNKSKDGRDFASKVYALNEGIKNLSAYEYDFIGILDADVSFEPGFYSSLICEFEKDPNLGIAGGNYFDIVNGKKISVPPSPYSIRGATQFFRRDCFEQIGGIKPIKYGGEDALACYAARMYGWDIKNIKNLMVIHHRPTGSAGSSIFRTRFRDGFVEYNLSYHPLFQFIKCARRINEKPFIVGSILRFLGYWIATFSSPKKRIPSDLMQFIRNDQLKRIIKFNLDISI